VNFADLTALIKSKTSVALSTDAGETYEIGRVVSIADGIAKIIGLPNAFYSEIIEVVESGIRGMILELSTDYVSVVIFGDAHTVKSGDIVRRTKNFMCGPCGRGMLGRVVNGVGLPIDGLGELKDVVQSPIERGAPSIMDRQTISEPLYTGILSVDSGLAIGKGQRELIIGDRRTGKTSVAINAILNQKTLHDLSAASKKEYYDKDGSDAHQNDNFSYTEKTQGDFRSGNEVYCVYVAIGQKKSTVAKLLQHLRDTGAMDYSIVVAATASDSAAEQFVAPYLGCSIAEWFRDNGMHALIVYDDLSKHATAYREISLLLRRPPGREAYPGDVFYLHARLLERAAKLNDQNGGGSLTALPIIETQGGDMSAYIPTNIISITDGQIYLDPDMFNQGIRPAIDVPLSVSRIGSSAQNHVIKKLSFSIKSKISQYKEMLSFAKFASSLDANAKKILTEGKILEFIMQQEDGEILQPFEEVVYLFVYQNGLLNDIESSQIRQVLHKVKQKSCEYANDIYECMNSGVLSDSVKDNLKKLVKQVIADEPVFGVQRDNVEMVNLKKRS
jgi:F-type H+-transporting ATPase subunit alpha